MEINSNGCFPGMYNVMGKSDKLSRWNDTHSTMKKYISSDFMAVQHATPWKNDIESSLLKKTNNPWDLHIYLHLPANMS